VHVKAFRVENFRRLKNVRVDLEEQTTIFVGANNSGKTSATHVFQLFLEPSKAQFQIYDFTADCWDEFNGLDITASDADADTPRITLDLWFEVDEDNIHRVLDLLPSLAWNGEPIGLRMVYGPKDGCKLLANYEDARQAALPPDGQAAEGYKPWPQNLTDYLSKRLSVEYEIKYYVLDANCCNGDLIPQENYSPFQLIAGAPAIVDALIRVDFLDAQRHLTDSESHGRAEDLSKRLSRFYQRNLQKHETNFEALGAITNAESRLNDHFADVFAATLNSIGELGYPGISNPGLVIKASFNAHNILSTSARVHYALPTADGAPPEAAAAMLPDQFNGLGFKNLIYMAIEILDFHHAWADTVGDRPPVHLIMVEEPEAHLHAQLQQVFIRKVFELLGPPDKDFRTQLVVTTHSSHILYESHFRPVRYFSRAKLATAVHCSDVKNLSTFYDGEESTTREFLQQYLKLTHCDLFFADAAILVEGNVERLLLPLLIARHAEGLRACHLTILEVGGAFAHRFQRLIEFLDITTLVITDLDSVEPVVDEEADEEQEEPIGGKACLTTQPDAVTSNETLKQWVPRESAIDALLNLPDARKLTADGNVRVAYQTRQPATWLSQTRQLAGRTLEEAFAMQNLAWTQHPARKALGLHIRKSASDGLDEIHLRIFKRVKNFDKTRFALGLLADSAPDWSAPEYLLDGLAWLQTRMQAESELPAPGAAPEVIT
jgi:predicted ATP-dependent endonuclease of OLD family